MNQFKGSFAKNVFTLASGTSIAQLILVLSSILLARIYTPEEFGIFSLFLSIVAILGAIVNGKYDLAIMLPKDDYESLIIVKICFYLSFIMSLIIQLVIFLFNGQIVNLIGENNFKYFLYLVPLSIFITAIYTVLCAYNVRDNNYLSVSKSNVIKSSTLCISQIVFGLLNFGAYGLIFGQIVSYLTGNNILLKNIRGHLITINRISNASLLNYAKKYKKFPFFALPSALLNSGTLNGFNVFISSMFNIVSLGYYSLASRVLSAPSVIIGRAVSTVYYRQAAYILSEGGGIEKLFLRTFLRLTTISLPVFGFLYLVVSDVFILAFGEEWSVAGKYAEILMPLIAVRFISSSLSNSLTVIEKQEFTLIVNIFLFLTLVLLCCCSLNYNWDMMFFLKMYTLLFSIAYTLFIIFYFIMLRRFERS